MPAMPRLRSVWEATRTRGFGPLTCRYESRIAAKNEQLESMLRILLATCETALDAFRAADNPIDTEFVVELERITERTRLELAALAEVSNRPS
jgi:hypothetical protein